MTITLRQLATQVSNALSSQAVSVQDLIDAAAALNIPLAGQDGNDPGDAIEQIVLEAVQVAQVKNCSFGEAIVSLKDSAPKAPPTRKRGPRKGQQPKFSDGKAKPDNNDPAKQSNLLMEQKSQQDGIVAGVMGALKKLRAQQQGEQLVYDLLAGRREPANDFERMILEKGQEYSAPVLSPSFFSLTDAGEVTLDCEVEEGISVEDAFEGVLSRSLRLVDLETTAPALPSAD